MKSIQVIAFFLVAALPVTIVNAQKDFKTDATTGVQYRFIKQDKKGIKPTDTNFARIIMLWTGKNVKGDADSVYLDTHKKGGDSNGVITLPLKKSFNGCLEQGVIMMAKGDSAIFHINADSLFLKTFHAPPDKIPHYITSSSVFTFNIKLVGFKTKAELMADRQAEMKKRAEKIEVRKAQESVDIAAYLEKNELNVKPDADSIFYLHTTKGNGKHLEEGDSLEVKYTGMLLDGTVFDKSDRGVGKGTFSLLYSKNMALIKGWIKILGNMNEGDKVRVLIPSAMGYGARGMGPIQPYTPMIFDMELVSVKSNK